MSILAWTASGADAASPKTESRGFAERLFEAIAASQSARVMPLVTASLQKLSDEELVKLGHSRADIARLRKLPPATVSYML